MSDRPNHKAFIEQVRQWWPERPDKLQEIVINGEGVEVRYWYGKMKTGESGGGMYTTKFYPWDPPVMSTPNVRRALTPKVKSPEQSERSVADMGMS